MKKLTGIVFHDEFRTMDQASPRITLWQDGSIDKKAKPALLLIAEEEEQLPEVMTKEEHEAKVKAIIADIKVIAADHSQKCYTNRIEQMTPPAPVAFHIDNYLWKKRGIAL